VYHKPPESFVTKLKGLSKGGRGLKVKEDEEDASEYDQTETEDGEAPAIPHSGGGNAPAPKPQAGGTNLLDLDMGDLGLALPQTSQQPSGGVGGLGLFDISVPSSAPAPVQKTLLLTPEQGRGMQIAGAFTRSGGRLVLDLTFPNFAPTPLGNFVIQFDKNTFGLAPASVQVPTNMIGQGQAAEAQVGIVTTGVVSGSQPSNSIKIAVKNNISPDIFFFQAPVPFSVLFTEGGQLERSAYLSMWKSIPDANESTRDIALNGPLDLDFLVRKLTSRNMFEIARRKVNDQDVVYLSVKTENLVYILVELTFKYNVRQCKLSCKTSNLELVPFFEQAVEQLLNQ